jgi:hypothetical protein
VLLATGFHDEPWLSLPDASMRALGARFGAH